jgi:peptidyl-prolyl cis-trans isomerase B (cyclophilin B)
MREPLTPQTDTAGSTNTGQQPAARRSPGQHRAPTRRRPVRWLVAGALVLILAGGAGTAASLSRGRSGRLADPAPTASPAASPADGQTASPADGLTASPAAGTADGTAGPATCRYQVVPGEVDPEGVSTPMPPSRADLSGPVRVMLRSKVGDVTLELDATAAPCTVNSFVNLARVGFYADSACHRLTTAALFVLQCGDPTGTGGGGPGYRFDNENLPVGVTPAYPRGTVAMANSGPDTNGSQFFLVYEESAIDPNYPVFGKITAGLDVLDRVAKDGAPGGDGPPNLEVIIDTVDVG